MSRQLEAISPDDEFRQWVREQADKVRLLAGVIIGDGEEHAPILLVFGRSGETVTKLLSLGNWREKRVAHVLHRVSAMHPEAVGAILVTEAWVLDQRASDAIPSDISEAPARRECLSVNALRTTSKGTMQIVVFYPIVRPAGGGLKGSTLGEVPEVIEPYGTMTSGRMVVEGARH